MKKWQKYVGRFKGQVTGRISEFVLFAQSEQAAKKHLKRYESEYWKLIDVRKCE